MKISDSIQNEVATQVRRHVESDMDCALFCYCATVPYSTLLSLVYAPAANTVLAVDMVIDAHIENHEPF